MVLLSSLLAAALAAPSPAPAPARDLRGRVLCDGRPVAGAVVAALPVETPLEEARREARFDEAPRELARATTGRDGAFALKWPAGVDELRVQVSAEGFVPVVLAETYDAAGPLAPVEARLMRAASLAGTVLDVNGKPVAGATVTLRAEADGADTTPVRTTATSGPDGRFRLGGASARGNRVRIEAPGQATVELSDLRAGALRQAVRLQPGRALEGLVLRADQKPATGALVRLEGPVELRWVETAASGAFRLDGLPSAPGGSLVAEAGEAGRARTPVPAAGAARLVLAPTATLRGRVVDARSGAGVAGVRVALHGRDGGGTSGHSGADGRYELRGLAPGRYALRADHGRYARWQLQGFEVPAGGALSRDIPLSPAVTLVGRVVDEKGLPVAGAEGSMDRQRASGPRALRVLLDRAAPAFRSGPDGRFEATRLEAGTNLGLMVTHPDFERRTLAGLDLQPGRPQPALEIVMRRGLGITGIVKDLRGQPVADAELRLSRSFELSGGRGGRTMRVGLLGVDAGRPEVRSGPDGGFEFRGVSPGDYSLRVTKPGYATQLLDPVKLSEGAAPLAIALAPGATISGFVRDKAGHPLEGRQVLALPDDARGPLATASTEEPSASDGSFVIEGLVAGQGYGLVLPDMTRGGSRGTPVVAPAEGVELVSSTLGRVEGVALDADSGNPLTAFAVSYAARGRGGFIVRRGSRGGALSPGERVDVQDEQGRFALDNVPPGTWDFEVTAPGYEPGRAGSVVVEEGGLASGVEVRLRRGATLAGRVLEDGSGRPVPDAAIEVKPQGGGDSFPRFGPRAEGDVRSGPDGRFEVPGLGAGSYTVSASHPDYAEGAEAVTLRGLTTSVEVKLGRGARLAGAVTSGARPVAGASISLAAAGEGFGGAFGAGQEAVSDEAGRFRFEHLAPGRYTLSASLRGQASPPVEAVVQGGQAREDLVLQLEGGASLRGVVKGLTETERVGVTVRARGPEQYFASTRTGADGTFELSGAPPGPITLDARAGDFDKSRGASAQVVVPEGQSDVAVEILFENGYKIEGRFTRAGEPVAEAFVAAFSRDGAGASATTDASGLFALEGLPAGRYELRATAQGAAGGASARREVNLRSDTTVDLTAALGRLGGNVFEAETRRPLNDAMIELSSDTPRFERASTDSAGRFDLEDLEPGPRTLTARKPGYETVTRPVEVLESGEEVTLELRRGEGVGLVARDGIYGTPLRQVFVRVVGAGGASLFTGGVPLDSEGRGEVPALPPGTYELRADASGYAPVMLHGVAVPTAALAVTLTPGGTLEIASGPESLGRPGARAMLVAADGLPYFVNIFMPDAWLPLGQPVRQVENVAPGTYTLAVDGGATRPVEVREGGTTRVELP